MAPFNVKATSTNHLLAALPQSDYQRLVPNLTEVSLALGQVLYEPGDIIKHVYFPNRTMVSLVCTMEDGVTTEVGTIGVDGIVGYPAFLGGASTTSRAVVQIEGTAMKMNAEILRREFTESRALQKLLLLHTQAFLIQVSQTAACNRLHPLEERLARWLLTAQDCALSDELQLTQEFIANMLGTRRAGVTVAAGALQRAGIISYSRGKITVLDRDGLEAAACECYGVVKREEQRLLNSEG